MSKLFFESHKNIGKLLENIPYSKAIVLLDENTEKHCYPLIIEHLPAHQTIVIKAGEINKTLENCSKIWSKLSSEHADREAILINLGGGVVTDIGGFCAATYKRGIRFINIPTSLLAQVDASAGGKTGIDYQDFKNQIGVFKEPEFVLIDNAFHSTLTNKEKRSGFAEMLKHGLIADKKHWQELIDIGYEAIPIESIKHSVNLKQHVVATDPLEKGERKILNFGHTVGHAIESAALNGKDSLLHGEAIALGMIAEAFIAKELKYLTVESYEEIKNGIRKYYAEVGIKKALRPQILRLCKQDKKNSKDLIQMSLLTAIGAANFNVAVSEELIEKALDECS